jgi:hypothetical protein
MGWSRGPYGAAVTDLCGDAGFGPDGHKVASTLRRMANCELVLRAAAPGPVAVARAQRTQHAQNTDHCSLERALSPRMRGARRRSTRAAAGRWGVLTRQGDDKAGSPLNLCVWQTLIEAVCNPLIA